MSTSPTSTPGATEVSSTSKVDEAVAVGGAIAEGIVPSAAPLIAAGVELEPSIHNLISMIIAMFHKKKVVAK